MPYGGVKSSAPSTAPVSTPVASSAGATCGGRSQCSSDTAHVRSDTALCYCDSCVTLSQGGVACRGEGVCWDRPWQSNRQKIQGGGVVTEY
jgi:hypothetical protein